MAREKAFLFQEPLQSTDAGPDDNVLPKQFQTSSMNEETTSKAGLSSGVQVNGTEEFHC